MSAIDTGFFALFFLLVGALMLTNFLQARTNMKTPYQNYFGVAYLTALVALIVVKMNQL